MSPRRKIIRDRQNSQMQEERPGHVPDQTHALWLRTNLDSKSGNFRFLFKACVRLYTVFRQHHHAVSSE